MAAAREVFLVKKSVLRDNCDISVRRIFAINPELFSPDIDSARLLYSNAIYAY